jgi:hypothetical protein
MFLYVMVRTDIRSDDETTDHNVKWFPFVLVKMYPSEDGLPAETCRE